jgi:hypothetical protein
LFGQKEGGTATLRVVYQATLIRDNDGNGIPETVVETLTGDFLVTDNLPWSFSRPWTHVCDGVYTALIEAQAYYLNGNETSDAGESNEIVGFTCQDPTAVTVASFTASPAGAAIALGWVTATELDNQGFNVYRAEAFDGPRAKLNAALIPSQMPGSPVGATYQFRDESASPGVTYFYWLEDVDLYGEAMSHGPVSTQLPVVRRLLPARPRPVVLSPVLRGQ